jgi:hypothetical protein
LKIEGSINEEIKEEQSDASPGSREFVETAAREEESAAEHNSPKFPN